MTHAEPPPPASPQPSSPPTRPPGPVRCSSPYRTLLTVVAAFVGLFLVIRTIAVEPFGVPTGSMAPALIGHHRQGACPRCGYTVRVGRPARGSDADHFANVACPNCEQRFSLVEARDLNGDRLLVDKNVYGLRRPRRWEMVVFRCPDPDPDEHGKPYVKRLVGLPGETILLREGDAYADGEIVRKGLAEVRETTVPVFDMNFPPTGGGWAARWVAWSGAPRRPEGLGEPVSPPVIEENALVLDASESPRKMAGATYRHWNLDDRCEEPVRAWTAYDGAPRRLGQLPPAHDFVLTCEVEVTAAAPGGEASFACRLLDGADAVSAELTVGPKGSGRVQLVREGHGEVAAAGGVALEVGRTYALEFAFVDRRVLLALDGRLVASADLPAVKNRDEVSRPLQLGSRGCRVVVRNLKLGRDVHYTTDYGEHGTRRPVTMKPGEHFVLGDNSGNSQDSRKWPSPGVPEADFIGKPFLIHQPLRVGRFALGGAEREVQTLDWSRLRWLH